MKKLTAILLALVLTGCAVQTAAPAVTTLPTAAPTEQTTAPAETTAPTTVATEPTTEATEPPTIYEIYSPIIDSMTTEELVGQLFLAHYPGHEQAAADIENYHIGGFLLFSYDFERETPESIRAALDVLQQQSKTGLLIATDEEGGTVTRVSRHSQFRDSLFPSPRSLYDEGGLPLVLEIEEEKCKLLLRSGVNVNIGPVCDITTEAGAFMHSRSLGQDPDTTAQYITQVVQTMHSQGVGNVLKHFPGYGNNADTHIGTAVDNRTLQTLTDNDLVPFAAGIEANCDAIMVSHTVIGCLDDRCPATLSPVVVGYLRDTMGFEGVIITDDMAMDAITRQYSSPSAALLAVLAGNDLICTSDYQTQYEAILLKVNDGTIPIERIRQSVARILKWKDDLGLL